MRLKLGILLIVATVLLWAGALCAPRLMYKDRDAGLTRTGAAMLKVKASQLGLQVPTVWKQITDVPDPSAFPRRSDEYAVIHGVVVWRGPFGIAFGTTEILQDSVVDEDYQAESFLLAWVLFLVPELVLVGLAIFCFAPAIRRHWPKIQERVSRWERRRF